jgi:hypothetical protein
LVVNGRLMGNDKTSARPTDEQVQVVIAGCWMLCRTGGLDSSCGFDQGASHS